MFFTNYQSQASFLEMKIKESQVLSLGKPLEAFLYANLNAFMTSTKRKTMLTAQRYFSNEPDIKDRKRYYTNRNGEIAENTILTNTKLFHPFMRKLTKQKVNYLLSKPFSINADNDDFSTALSKYFGAAFYRQLKVLGYDAVINGITWMQPYYDLLGDLKFKRIASEEVVPFWTDADHTELSALMRFYKILRYGPDGSTTEVMKIEYYTSQGVWYYVENGKGLIPDPDKAPGIHGNFNIEEAIVDQNGDPVLGADGKPTTQIKAMTWNRIPFVAFKYNAEEMSLLQLNKSLIDDYDVNSSDTSNNLQDIPNSIKIVKGYDGTNKEEFTHNLAVFRTAFVGVDGDLTALETPLDVAAIDSHLNRLRKDIYEASNGVDTQETDLGNASGVTLKFRYADLDMDADDLASEFAFGIEQLAWFIKLDLVNKGLGDFRDEEFEIVFNSDGIVNESEVITDAKNSVGLVSDETILANHPWVTDVQEEMDKVTKENEEKMKQMQESLGDPTGGFGAPQDPNKKPDPNSSGAAPKDPAVKTGV